MHVPYSVIALSGTPEDRGRTYGREAKEKILRSIENYKELFEARVGISWERAKLISKEFLPYVEQCYADGVEEMRGIAEGAGLEFEDILTLNCRSEIIFAIPDGCTAVGILPRYTTDGHTLLGQNWDWSESSADTIVVLKIKQDPLPSMIIFTEAGIIGGKGVNDRGLGVTLTATSCGKGRIGVPLHIMYRAILNSTSISHAFETVTAAHRAGSGCFNIGCADGLLASLEFSPDNFDILMPVDKPLSHTNHYLSAQLQGLDKKYVSTHTNTVVRLNAARQALSEHVGKFDMSAVKKVFSDHRNYPNSVCKHADPLTPVTQRSITVYSVIFDLTDRKILFFPGNTCETTPVTFEVAK